MVLIICLGSATLPEGVAQSIVVGAGTSNKSLNSSNLYVYNFGITTQGANQALSVGSIFITVQGGALKDNVQPVLLKLYSSFGGGSGGGSLIATATLNASLLNTSARTFEVAFPQNVQLTAGAYSVVVETANAASYNYKAGALLSLNDGSGATLSNNYWIQDSRTDGNATTTISPQAGYVLADYALSATGLAFGNYRVGGTATRTVTVTNSGFATANNTTEALRVSGLPSAKVNLSGVPSSALAQGQQSLLSIGLQTDGAGPQTESVTLEFSSTASGTSSTRTGGDVSLGSHILAISGTGYRAAEASTEAVTLDLGRFHVGATPETQTIAITNTALSTDAYTEKLRVSISSTTGDASGSAPSGLIAAGASTDASVGLGAIHATGQHSGQVVFSLATDGTGTSGLDAASLGSRVVTLVAQGYSGQASWNRNTGGTWNSFDSWDNAGGKPGLDGALSTQDSATFGAGPTGATIITLDGTTPVLTALTFATAEASYAITGSPTDALVLGTASSSASVTTSAGQHTIATDLTLMRATGFATATNTALALSGNIAGAASLTKTGAGRLTLSGTNTFTGDTSVESGMLVVNGSLASPSVTIAPDATLAGSGVLSGSITISGLHAPGNSPGVQTLGHTTYTSTATFQWELQTNTATQGAGTLDSPFTFDQVLVAGDLTLIGSPQFKLSFDSPGSQVDWTKDYWTADRQWTVFTVSGTTTGSFELLAEDWLDSEGRALTAVRSNASFTLRQVGQDIVLGYTAIPEPSSIAAFAGALAFLGLLLQRRQRA